MRRRELYVRLLMMMMMMNDYLRYKHRSVIGVLYYSTVDSLPEDQ